MRLLVVGKLSGQLSTAVKMAMSAGAKVSHVESTAAALQFLLAHPAIASHVPGTRSVEQMKQNIAWVSHSIPVDLWYDLKRQGLLREDAPVPA